jgi:GNAT superfamily N-acetyltransferase
MIRIRRATLRDLDTLVRHRRRMFEDMGLQFSDEDWAMGDREYRRWVKRLMPRREFIGWIAVTSKGEPVAGGAVWLQERQPRPGLPPLKMPYLLSMFTERAYRGRGLASRIVKEAMRWTKVQGFPYMTLHASKEGRRVYKKLRFKRSWEMGIWFKRKPS